MCSLGSRELKPISECAAVLGVVTSMLLVTTFAAPQNYVGASALSVYNAEKLSAKATGIYEYGDWVFFHSREELVSTQTEDKIEAEASARENTREAMFRWIDEHTKTGIVQSPTITQLKNLNSTFLSDDDAVVERSILVSTHVLDCCAENGKWFVFTMAVAKKDLLADAAKGPFADRPDSVYGQWGIISRNRIGQTNQVEFLRQSGAMDLLTLGAEERKGVNVLSLKNSDTNEICRSCIEDLRNSILALNGDSVDEYKKVLENLYFKLEACTNQFPEVLVKRKVWVMMLSFASCLQEAQSPDMSGIKAYRAFRAKRKDPAVIRKDLINALNETPGSALLWSALGECYLEQDAIPLALSCFRDALRVERNYPYALDRMAAAYERYECPVLAKGLALFAYALTDEEEYRKNATRILGIKK